LPTTTRPGPTPASGGERPAEVFAAKVKAHPAEHVPHTHFRVRHDRVDKTGCVTLRHESRLIHIGIGRAHKGERILLLVADRDVRVVNEDGEPIRQLTIDPSRDYQGSTMSRDICLRCLATSQERT
jgi:hypothetical protein